MWHAAAAGLVLFFSVGIRQGFGLFLVPVVASGVITRSDFSLAVALQYLIWGCTGPLAAKLADRIGSERVLALGAALYAIGFACAGKAESAWVFVLGAGVLIGLGLGLANYGVVNGWVANVVPAHMRGRALGVVGSLTALGQLLLLFFTHWSLGAGADWRSAFGLHALCVLAIAPVALLMWRLSGASDTRTSNTVHADGHSGSSRDMLLLCLGFGLSGFQVMFTMTHLPALLAGRGESSGTATWMLAILSGSSFLGSYFAGRWSETLDKRRLLAGIYAARAVGAALFMVLPDDELVLGAYFFLLGLVWMSTFPVVTAITAELFGVRRLALLFGYVFLAHQAGGFVGTWLGGIVAQRWGSYAPMFPLVCALCLLAAASALRISAAAPPTKSLEPAC